MNDSKHTVLCVDDEQSILSALKRLLRKEGYNLITASSGPEGLKILKGNDVHLIICDQRMPGMSGTEFLAIVQKKYSAVIRIVLTGYTEVDAITEAINKGHVYKFFLKPWNDQSLKLEIKQALEQYDLIQANKTLNRKVLEQNEELKKVNEHLEEVVQERTEVLKIQNRALELSRAMLEDLPMPILGVGAEGVIAVINQSAQGLSCNGKVIGVGNKLSDYFSTGVQEKAAGVFKTNETQRLEGYQLSDRTYDIDLTPLSGRFQGKGIILTLTQTS